MLDALDSSKPNAKLKASPLLTEYVLAVAEWSVRHYAQNPSGFKRENRVLYAVVERHKDEPNRSTAIAADMLATITGMGKETAGFAGAMAQRYGNNGTGISGGRS